MAKISDGGHSLTLFFNPLWKALGRYLASKCEKCGQERLLSVFDAYSGSWHFACGRCLLTSTALAPLIRLLFFSFGVNNSTIKRLTKDMLIRKCLLSVVKGIANFGINIRNQPVLQQLLYGTSPTDATSTASTATKTLHPHLLN